MRSKARPKPELGVSKTLKPNLENEARNENPPRVCDQSDLECSAKTDRDCDSNNRSNRTEASGIKRTRIYAAISRVLLRPLRNY